VHCAGMILCKDWADSTASADGFGARMGIERPDTAIIQGRAMKLTLEIAAATLLVICISVSSAAFAAGKTGRSADGLSCGFSVPANASPAARCAAIKRQCGGKFAAN